MQHSCSHQTEGHRDSPQALLLNCCSLTIRRLYLFLEFIDQCFYLDSTTNTHCLFPFALHPFVCETHNPTLVLWTVHLGVAYFHDWVSSLPYSNRNTDIYFFFNGASVWTWLGYVSYCLVFAGWKHILVAYRYWLTLLSCWGQIWQIQNLKH